MNKSKYIKFAYVYTGIGIYNYNLYAWIPEAYLAIGSTPAVGSSRTTTFERPMNATATQIRRRIPSDKFLTARSFMSSISIDWSNL